VRDERLLVYQMGRVGSKTIEYSLKAIGLLPYHVHTLSDKGLSYYKDMLSKSEEGSQQFKKYHNKLKEIEHLRIQIKQGKGKWKVITLTRDPVARNISFFFYYFFNLQAKSRFNLDAKNLEGLLSLFLKSPSLDGFNTHETPLLWFDVEMKAVFGIDVYKTKFPFHKGYEIYNGEKADVLLIRLEDLARCYQQAFKEFLSIESFKLINKNIASTGLYSSIYEQFCKNVVLPEEYVDKMYNSRYVRHFYTEEEIDFFRRKWSGIIQLV